MSTTITALVIDVKPVRNTDAGNTVKRVALSVATEGYPGVVEMLTGRDSAIGASIENQEYRDKPHVFTISRDLRIKLLNDNRPKGD